MENLSGRQFGPYQLLEPLGEGGMATVYKAFQPIMNRHVALKILPRHLASDPGFMERFQREAQLVAQMQHPHILPVFDFGLAEGYAYIVMPLIAGGTLAQRMEIGPLPPEQALEWAAQIADALDYAHQHGLIHRDIKPSNVLLDERDNCLLTDFGLAKLTEMSATSPAAKLTISGAILGTPAYMSPEQGHGYPLDGRTDIYSLGIIIYEMVTGRPPYKGETPLAVLFKHVNDPLPTPRSVNPGLPETLEGVILRALAKRPEDRFQSAAEMRRELRATLEHLRTGGPVSVRPIRRIPAWTWAVMAGAIVLVLVIGAIVWRASTVATVVISPTASVPLATRTIAVVAPSNTAPPPATTQPPDSDTPAPIETATIPATETATETPLPPTFTPSPTTAALGIGATEVSAIDGMVLVFVPAGDFLRGASSDDTDGLPAEKPQRTVTVDAFWIDQTEVTNAMYTLCVTAEVCSPPRSLVSATRLSYYPALEYANYPVIYVPWEDARRYCVWAGRRLPTEAEWEKAARGTEGSLFPWGADAPGPTRANFGNSLGDTAAVGTYPNGASVYGALDMSGNVLEWVSDWYSGQYYATSPTTNPTGPTTGPGRAARGGAWDSAQASELRATARRFFAPGARENDLGFRCAR